MGNQLNADQLQLVETAIKFYESPGEYFLMIEGWAGVGKTFSLARIIHALRVRHPTMNVCLTAPTHPAVKVMETMAAEYGLSVKCKTIYSILGLVLDKNDEVKRVRNMGMRQFESMDLVAIDEGSMLKKMVWENLEEKARHNKVKVIIMGDRYQLPPVKEIISMCFTNSHVYAKLTKDMRTENGSPLRPLVKSLREDVMNNTSKTVFKSTYNETLDQGKYILKGVDWYNSVKANFISEEYKEDPSLFRMVAWTNKRVNSLNKSIRRLLVGETEEPYIAGEYVRTRAPLVDDISALRPETVVNTDGECLVLEVHKGVHPLYEGMSTSFKTWNMLLQSPEGGSVEAFMLHEDSRNAYETMCQKLYKTALKENSQWRVYWAFKDSFADLQPPHALTVHRSQGSTFQNVYVDIDDCFKNRKVRERTQLMYVACSRASDNLLLLRR